MTTGFIYLASASPRRSELLRQIGVPFRVLSSSVPEIRDGDEPPETYVARLAAAKAEAVWARVQSEEPAPVLAADTAVVLDGEIFGKPADELQACAMLERLSGRSHSVLTAVALRWQQAQTSLLSVSEVRFRPTTSEERIAYCRTGEPFDKAGGYAIQGCGAIFIDHLSGSYSGVMGLPIPETAALLRKFALPAWLRSAGS